LFGLLAVLVTVRVFLVDRIIGIYIACPGCFNQDVALADLVMFCAMASLLLLASCTRRQALVRLLHLLCGLMFLVYVTDLIVFGLYASRLLMTDAALFISEGTAVWDQFSSGLGSSVLAIGVLAGFAALFAFLWWMPSVRSRPFRLIMSLVMAASLAASAFLRGAPYVNDWAVENVFVANMSTPSRNRYSKEARESILAREAPISRWGTSGESAARGRDVILVIVESWSPWHSALFGGFEDWTPNLDAAARRGLRFDNFHSIGFSTDKGLVGILAGQKIWAPFLHWFQTPPFHSMWGVERTLPSVFKSRGYHTAFLTTGPLSLYQKGEWMSDIGFDEVEGNENPFYDGRKRYAFRAASDQALYERALQWMQAVTAPWVLVLETVSTHQPYMDPESGERSFELAMKYTDREFGVFLDELDDIRFFEDGVLVVLSDHRSMTPMSRTELELWGQAAYSLVPAFVIGSEFTPGSVNDSVFSQSDLVPTLEWWLSGEVGLEPLESVMLDPGFDEPNCAYHERGDRRGLVEVFCDTGHGQVILDGDSTRFVGSPDLSPERQEIILNDIGRQRLEAWHRHLTTSTK